MTAAVESVRAATNRHEFGWLARLGLAARATIYLLIGWLALLIANGHRGQEADQSGALHEVARQRGGEFLLWLIAVGLVGYALWRLKEAAFGVTGEGDKKGPRLQSLVRGIIYAFFAVNCLDLLLTSTSASQAARTQILTGDVMQHTAGRWLVGLLGVVVVIVALVLVHEGITRKFEERLKTTQMSTLQRRAVVTVGAVGTTARGVVFGIAGVLVIQAAVTYDPAKARGLDGALKTLARSTAGPFLLVLIAIGLMVFGLFGFAEARWART